MRLLHAGPRGVVSFFTQTAHGSAKKHEANRIRLRGACNDAEMCDAANYNNLPKKAPMQFLLGLR